MVWVGRDLEDHLVPTPLPWAGTPSTRPGCYPVPSNLALNTAREGAATASLGSLFQCFTTLTVKNFFLISNLNLPSFSLQPFPLVCHYAPFWKVPLHPSCRPLWPPGSLSVMLHVVAGESDSWDSQQVWRKPASVQRVCKDLIVSVAGGPVKTVWLWLVTEHSPSGNLWGQRNRVCLASWAACCENFLCEKKLSNGASCCAVQFESKVTTKAWERGRERVSPRLRKVRL